MSLDVLPNPRGARKIALAGLARGAGGQAKSPRVCNDGTIERRFFILVRQDGEDRQPRRKIGEVMRQLVQGMAGTPGIRRVSSHSNVRSKTWVTMEAGAFVQRAAFP